MEHCLVPIGLAALDEQGRLPLQNEQPDKLQAAGLTILEVEASSDLLGRDQFRWLNVSMLFSLYSGFLVLSLTIEAAFLRYSAIAFL
jgi:hypothetical protein